MSMHLKEWRQFPLTPIFFELYSIKFMSCDKKRYFRGPIAVAALPLSSLSLPS